MLACFVSLQAPPMMQPAAHVVIAVNAVHKPGTCSLMIAMACIPFFCQSPDGTWNRFGDDVDHEGRKINWDQWAITSDDPVFKGTGNPDTGGASRGQGLSRQDEVGMHRWLSAACPPDAVICLSAQPCLLTGAGMSCS